MYKNVYVCNNICTKNKFLKNDQNDSCECTKVFISLISIIINSHGLPTKHETLKTTCYSINIKKEFMKKQRKIFHILVLEAYLHSFEDIEIHGMMMGFSWNCSGLIWIPDYDISIRPRSYHTWTKQLELGLSPVKLHQICLVIYWSRIQNTHKWRRLRDMKNRNKKRSQTKTINAVITRKLWN